jgi:hypothetical protein
MSMKHNFPDFRKNKQNFTPKRSKDKSSFFQQWFNPNADSNRGPQRSSTAGGK